MDLNHLKSLEKPYLDIGMKLQRHKVECPAHGGHTVDCHKNEETNHIVWKCFSCGEGGTIIDAYAHKHGLPLKEALKELISKYGDEPVTFREPKRKTTSFSPAVKIETTDQKIAPPSSGYIVNDGIKLYIKDAKIWKQECLANGELVAAAALRWDLDDGSKVMRQAHYNGTKWIMKGFPWLPVPLYNEEMFEKAERIIFVEGEKCMDKLQENIDIADISQEDYPFTVVTTNIGGSNAIKKANVKPLKDKLVYYVRDNDEPGLKMMTWLEEKIGGLVINPADINPEAEDGYDVYDYLTDGYPVEALYELVENKAPEYTIEEAYAEAGSITEPRQVIALFEKITESRIEVSHGEIDRIVERLKKTTGLSKGALNADWREVSGKGQKKDWPDLVMRHAFEKGYKEKLIYVGKTYWYYDRTHWKMTELVGQKIYHSAGHIIKPGVYDKASAITKAEQLMARHTAKEQDWLGLNKKPKKIINVKNGELHIQNDGTIQVCNHNPDSKMTYCIQTAYEPTADCPLYDRAIRDIFEGNEDLVRHFEEVVGYMIQPDRFMKNFFVFWGPKGNNGKTVLTHLMKSLMGDGTTLTRKIHTFGDDKHDTVQLVGKMLLVDDDMQKGVTLNDGLLKEISELKELTANPKNRDTYPFTSYAAVLICCNNLPRTNDLTEAMRSRANFIPFYRRFTEEEVDRELFPKIEETELSGVLNRFLSGLERLMKRGDWDYPEIVEQAKDKWLSYTSTIYDFVTSHFVMDGDDSITIQDFRIKYVNWCEAEGIDPKYRIQNRNIRTSLEDLGFTTETADNNSGGWKLTGISIIDD